MTTKKRPSERFCKHGFLTESERYDPDLHKKGKTVEERCKDFYTPEEIERMKGEIKVAECGICMEEFTSIYDCRVCSDGHRFHNTCLTNYWYRNPTKKNFCPITNSIPTGLWDQCNGINDINSGGRRRKTINKKRKSRKNRMSRKYRMSRKNRMSRK